MSQKRQHVPVAQRRRQLTEAAMTVMRRDGAWSLTTRAVAKEAGVPLGAVHYAFANKSELIAAVFAADVESAVVTARSATADGGTSEEVIGRALRTWMAGLQRDSLTEAVLQELTLMGARDPELAALADRAVVDYRNGVAAFLDRVAELDGSRWDAPTQVIAEGLFAQFLGLAQNWIATGDDGLLYACVDDVISVLSGRLGLG